MISDERLFEVAVAYYIQKKTQVQIAKDLGVSHVQVGKYLKEALKRDIVSITVNLPVSKDEEGRMRSLFKEIFGLKHLVLVQGSENSDKSLERVVSKATSYLLDAYPDVPTRVGYGWGRTMQALSLNSSELAQKTHWTYIPACILAKGTDNSYYDTIRLTRNLAEQWGGRVDEEMVEKLELARKTQSEELMADCRRSWQNLSFLICGLGCATNRYPKQREGLFSEQVFKEVNMKSLVGDILHNFYDIDGNVFPGQGKDLMIPLEDMHKIPTVIAVASGFPKVESIIGGLRSGLVDTLVTDVQTARHVIEYLK